MPLNKSGLFLQKGRHVLHTCTNNAFNGNPNYLWKNNFEGHFWLFAMSPQACSSHSVLPNMEVPGRKVVPTLCLFGGADPSMDAFLGPTGCPRGGTKSWQGLGAGTEESNPLWVDKQHVAGLHMALGLPPHAAWPKVWYLPVRTCRMGLWPFFETFSLRVYFGSAQAFVKFLGNGRFEARLVKGGEGRWEKGSRRRVFHYPVIASLTWVLRLCAPLQSCELLKRGEREKEGAGGREGASFLVWEAGSGPEQIGLAPVSLVSHPSAAFGLRSRSAELVNSSESTRHLKQIRSLIATQRLMMDGGLYLQQN